MPFEHPTIKIHRPAQGHHVITGHSPVTILGPDGYVVPLESCYISPEVPSEALLTVLEERGIRVLDGGNPIDLIAAALPGNSPQASIEEIAETIRTGFKDRDEALGRVIELEKEQADLRREVEQLKSVKKGGK